MAAGEDIFQTEAVLANARVARGLAAQFEARERALAAADPLGWKIGLNAPAAMERLGTSGPVLGFLTRDALLAAGDQLLVADMAHPGLEPELAIHLGAGVDAAAGPAEALAAIAEVGAALEIVDIDLPIEDVEQILAGNVFQRRVLLGEQRFSPDRLELPAKVTVDRNGEQIAEATSIPSLDGLAGTVSHVAKLVASQGAELAAGEVIIAGSLTPILEISPGDRMEADFGSLGRLELSFA